MRGNRRNKAAKESFSSIWRCSFFTSHMGSYLPVGHGNSLESEMLLGGSRLIRAPRRCLGSYAPFSLPGICVNCFCLFPASLLGVHEYLIKINDLFRKYRLSFVSCQGMFPLLSISLLRLEKAKERTKGDTNFHPHPPHYSKKDKSY